MPITEADLENWFSYHAPQVGDPEKYAEIRDAARRFAGTIVRLTPASANQRVAVRKVREAVMVANAAIACGGK